MRKPQWARVRAPRPNHFFYDAQTMTMAEGAATTATQMIQQIGRVHFPTKLRDPRTQKIRAYLRSLEPELEEEDVD